MSTLVMSSDGILPPNCVRKKKVLNSIAGHDSLRHGVKGRQIKRALNENGKVPAIAVASLNIGNCIIWHVAICHVTECETKIAHPSNNPRIFLLWLSKDTVIIAEPIQYNDDYHLHYYLYC